MREENQQSPESGGMIGREYERQLLHDYLSTGKCVQIVAPGGFGKTTLLLSLLEADGAKEDRQFAAAYVDLKRCDTVTQLVRDVWSAWRQLKIDPPGFPSPSLRSPELQDYLRRWRSYGARPVLLLDDFEQLLARKDEFTSDFYLDLQALTEQGCAIVITSRQPLGQMLPYGGPVALFLNSFAMLRLGPLSAEEMEKFLNSRLPAPVFTPEEKREIIEFVGGNPLALHLASGYALAAKDSGQQLSEAFRRAREEMFERDPTLLLLVLRREVETRLRKIVSIRSAQPPKTPGLIQLGQVLKRDGALTAEQFSLLYELASILNKSAHSEPVDASSIEWAVRQGSELCDELDKYITKHTRA